MKTNFPKIAIQLSILKFYNIPIPIHKREPKNAKPHYPNPKHQTPHCPSPDVVADGCSQLDAELVNAPID